MGFESQIKKRLSDKRYTEIGDDVSSREVEAIAEALRILPEPALKTFLNSDCKVFIGNREFLEAKSGSSNKQSANAWFKQASPRDNISPSISVRNDMPHVGVNKLYRMGLSTIHEAGHGLDHINDKSRSMRSIRSSSYRKSVDEYLERKKGQGKTEVFFEGERSFRHDHIPLPSYKNAHNDVVYAEHAAEMFRKFTLRSRKLGEINADKSLQRDYGSSWKEYKKEVCPQIQESIDAVGAKKEKKLGRTTESSSSEMKGVAASGFNKSSFGQQVKKIMQALVKGSRNVWNVSSSMISGKSAPTLVRDKENWDGQKINGQKVGIFETTGMSRKEISMVKNELSDNGIDFNSMKNSSGTRTSIVVSDPSSLERLERYVETGNPNPATSMASNRTMVMDGMGL